MHQIFKFRKKVLLRNILNYKGIRNFYIILWKIKENQSQNFKIKRNVQTCQTCQSCQVLRPEITVRVDRYIGEKNTLEKLDSILILTQKSIKRNIPLNGKFSIYLLQGLRDWPSGSLPWFCLLYGRYDSICEKSSFNLSVWINLTVRISKCCTILI